MAKSGGGFVRYWRPHSKFWGTRPPFPTTIYTPAFSTTFVHHSPITNLFKCNFSYLCTADERCCWRTLCLRLTAEFLLYTEKQTYCIRILLSGIVENENSEGTDIWPVSEQLLRCVYTITILNAPSGLQRGSFPANERQWSAERSKPAADLCCSWP